MDTIWKYCGIAEDVTTPRSYVVPNKTKHLLAEELFLWWKQSNPKQDHSHMLHQWKESQDITLCCTAFWKQWICRYAVCTQISAQSLIWSIVEQLDMLHPMHSIHMDFQTLHGLVRIAAPSLHHTCKKYGQMSIIFFYLHKISKWKRHYAWKNLDVILSDRLAGLKSSKPNSRMIKIKSGSCVIHWKE